MNSLTHLRGLPKSLLNPTARPVGAVLTVGRKDNKTGAPTAKDRFYCVETKSQVRKGNRGDHEFRPPDPRFEAYHRLDLAQRRKFYGVIMHHRIEEFFDMGLFAPKGPQHPEVKNPRHRGPWCHGNGEEAERWDGREYKKISCPGEDCPFRQEFKNARGHGYTPCKPKVAVYFLPRWPSFLGLPELECPPMKIASSGKEARDTFAGMLEQVERLASDLGVEIKSWLGLPFAVTLGSGANPEKRTRYPVLNFAVDGNPLDWLKFQAEQFSQLQAAPRLALGAASEAELRPEEVGLDLETIGPATKPVREE